MATIINYLEELYTAVSSQSAQDYELGRDLDFQDDASYNNPSVNKPLWTTGNGWYWNSGSPTNFIGNFDGKNHKISNLYVNNNTAANGLFSDVINTGKISNLIIENSSITHSVMNEGSGTIAAYLYNTAMIDNVHVVNGFVASTAPGGVVGGIKDNCIIQNCSFDGTLTTLSGAYFAGGIVAEIDDGSGSGCAVKKCRSKGQITGTEPTWGAGGIAGTVWDNTVLFEDCYVEMKLPNYNYSAGIIINYSGGVTVRRCYVSDSRNSTYTIGYNISTAENNFFDYDVNQQSATYANQMTTTQMKTLSTFANATWDIVTKASFNQNNPTTWFIDEGNDYPRLWFEYSGASSSTGGSGYYNGIKIGLPYYNGIKIDSYFNF